MTPFDELQARIKKIQAEMQQEDVSITLVIQRADLFYFSGTGQNAHLLIPAAGEPVLVVKKSVTRAREESALPQVVSFKNWDNLLAMIGSHARPGSKIGMETDVLPANLYLRYKKMLKDYSIVDISESIRRIRSVKSSYELEQLKQAALINQSVFNLARRIIREGMTEVDLAGRLEAHARSLGHQGVIRMRGFNLEMYYGHIMTGENASTVSFFDGPTGGSGLNPSFPQGAGMAVIRNNEPVLVDFASVYGGYMVDQTRIFCLGEPNLHLREAYRRSVQINQALAGMGRPGTAGNLLFEEAEKMAAEAGLANHFMGYVEKVSFVGHGVGLELDELPVVARGIEQPLKQGMVIALEPKFIFPGEGTVGIEDTYVVGCDGLEALTVFDDQIQIL